MVMIIVMKYQKCEIKICIKTLSINLAFNNTVLRNLKHAILINFNLFMHKL